MRISGTGNCNKGFTLLELAVVIFLVSIMLALALPSFPVIGESRIKSDAKRLSSILRYLNDSAVSAKETFSLKADFREKTIMHKGPDGEKKETFDSISSVELQSKGRVSEGELIIFFGPTGTSEAFSFILRDNDKTMTVSFNPLSGRVKIIQGEK